MPQPSTPTPGRSTKELFSSWSSWAKAAGELFGTEKRFVEALESAGFAKAKNREQTKRGFKGLKLNRPDLASDPQYAD
jgi:putative DNA primase/helicase